MPDFGAIYVALFHSLINDFGHMNYSSLYVSDKDKPERNAHAGKLTVIG